MKHWSKDSEGREREEQVSAQPPIPSVEDVERQLESEGAPRGGGGGALPADRPGGEGFEVEIDRHGTHLKLPDHPRGEGWIEPDPSKPIFPEK